MGKAVVAEEEIDEEEESKNEKGSDSGIHHFCFTCNQILV